MRARLRQYWLGTVDARPVALFRIAFAAVVAGDAIDRLRDLDVFYTDGGMFPRALFDRAFAAAPIPWLSAWMGSPAAAGLLFAVGIAAALALALGLAGRAPIIVVWIYLWMLAGRARFITDGGDAVMSNVAFWAMFIELDAAWSLRRGPRHQEVRALPVRLAECQVALIYLVAGVRKLNVQWLSGRALFHVLQNNDFARPTGMTLLLLPSLCMALTYATLIVELGFAPLALGWPRRGRAAAAAAAVGLHLGIYGLMRVGMFSFVMIASLCLFAPARWLGGAVDAPRSCDWPRRWRLVGALLAALMLIGVVGAFVPRLLPRPVRRALGGMPLNQQWGMFASGVDRDGYFAGDARLADGTSMDPLLRWAPAMLPQASLRFSRWYKLRDEMSQQPTLRLLLLDWICRRQQSPRMIEATLTRWERPTREPGEPPQPFEKLDETRWMCRDRPPDSRR